MPQDEEKSDCISCNRRNSAEDMVQCDNCKKWSHFSCAAVDATVAETSWECIGCTELNATIRVQQSAAAVVEKEGNDGPLESSSRQMSRQHERVHLDEQSDRMSKANQSVASISRKQNLKLEMRRLEEQKKLDDMFLEKKYELLALDEDFDDTPSDVRFQTVSPVRKVNQTVVKDNPRDERNVNNLVSDVKAEEFVALDQRQIAARQVITRELPQFSGNPEEWPLFISSFENTTKLCGFSPEENLWRLQRALKGAALRAVGSRLLLPSTVPEVISELRMLYGRPTYILQTMLRRIRAEPAPKADRLDTLIQYALSVRSLHSTIEAAGLTSHLNDPTLLQELVDKLPASIKLNWAIANGSQEPNLTLFSEWLYTVAEAASRVTTFAAIDGRNEKRSAHLHTHSEVHMPAKKAQQIQRGSGCYLCERDHKLTDCDLFKNLTADQRLELTRSKGVCEICLGHNKRFKCRGGRACGINGCVSKHHRLLHNQLPVCQQWSHQVQPPAFQYSVPSVGANNYTQPPPCQQSSNMVNGNYHAHQNARKEETLFSIVPVVLHGNGRSMETFAFLDSGSSLTLVEDWIADSLGLEGVEKQLCLKWTSDHTRLEEKSKIVPMEISAKCDGFPTEKYRLSHLHTVKDLGLPVQSLDMEKLNRKYNHLKGLPLKSYRNAQCGILIGISNQKLMLTQRLKEGRWKDPVAIKTRLGWCISGGCDSDTRPNGVYHIYEACECDKELHEIVRNYFVLEEHGTCKGQIESAEEVRARSILDATVRRQGNAFSSGLLWRFDNVVLPDSYGMALKRLRCLEKKMTVDTSLLQLVNGQIRDLVAKGYASKLSQEELDVYHPRTWYLPTFIVRNPNKPSKARLVWDAAASTQGVSLNSMLLKGPDELTVMTEVLHGFRTSRIAIAGDIEEMFHQVGVSKEDQNSQRFLWREGKSDRSPDVYVMQVLTFGATCSPSIAQHVKNKNAREFAKTFPRAVEAIIEHHYVDDLLDSMDTIEEAIQLAKDVKFIHSRGGFNIRNWLSNSKEVLLALGQPDGGVKTFNEHPNEMKCTAKVLGLWWDTEEDNFKFSLKFTKAHEEVLKGQRRPTKRELLRLLMSIYDPLGFLSFYLVKLKVLLQDVWRSMIDWDDAIPTNLQQSWESWRSLLSKVEDVRIPRCYLPEGFSIKASVELHVFVDASEDALAAVAYFRFIDGDAVDCTIVCAKCKVAPLKPLSIPRLELQAALMGSRLAHSIERSHKLNIARKFLWTDSRNVLCWLRADAKKFKPFVMFRSTEILELTQPQEWRWVPTKVNVADMATKWTKVPTFRHNNRWCKGPEFLYYDEDKWPDTTSHYKTLQDVEVQREELRPQFLLLTDVTDDEPMIDVHRFSSWKRLHRTMAWVLRFVTNMKLNWSGAEVNMGMLSSGELQRAETVIIQLVQKEKFSDELAMLLNGEKLPRSSQLFKCSPYMDDEGLLRLKGRIDSAWCVEEETKRPIIMPKNHHVTFLLVGEYHNRFHHRCQETVVNEVRQKFWIPQLRTLVRSVRLKCQKCKNDKAVPRNPEMAPLPEARLAAYMRPFSYTGVDYFGPIMIRSGRSLVKRWGVLFTCLTIRAIHIEVAHSLTTDSCIMCIRNFMSRRGTPREIFSDNGTNLRGAERELREAFHMMNKDVIQSTFTSAETRWYFNPPAAPHMGGCWERLIGSVKGVLKEITRNQCLEEESLRCMLIEVEGIINSRPLTHVSVEIDDEEALTPNHFLLGSSNGCKPPGDFNDKDLLRKSWRVAQQLSNMFWRRWVREYLPTLTRRTKWFQQVKNIEEGDVVIVVDENLPRNSWPKGIVISTVKAKDGQVRRATIRTAAGIYDRPVVRLAILDVSKSDSGDAAGVAASPRGRIVADG